MENFLKDLLKDKADNYSMREVIIAICMLLIIASFIAELGFSIHTPEFMFYGIIGLITTACVGYSIEKKQNTNI